MIVQVATAIGSLYVEVDAQHILRIWLPGEGVPGDAVRDAVAAESVTEPAWVRDLARDLQAYAAGAPVDLSPWAGRVDLGRVTPFRRRVYEALLRVGRGQTCTYGELAAAAGSAGAARAVGSAMAENPVPLIIPCHRVVAAGGLGGYGGGLELKRRLLALEGTADG